jgi:hypothetical protein
MNIVSNPVQAYLFGRLISSFATWGEQLRMTTSFLCLILLVVAWGLGVSYFALGWISNDVSVVGDLLGCLDKTPAKYK